MANTTNKDIDYIVKDFNSTVDALITFATVNYGSDTSANRLWTNFNVDSFSRNWLEIVAYVSDLFFFYFDNQATQSYLQTATIRSAIKNIAEQFGYSPASATSASGIAQFIINAAGTVPRGFRVRATNGEEFYLTSDIVAAVAGTYSGSMLQGVIKTEQFTSQGLQNEEFDLIGPNVIEDLTNLNPLDITPKVTVNGNSYTLVDTFIRNNGTDTAAVSDSLGNIVGGGGRVFTVNERPEGTPFLRFGDGIFGRKLQPGELISISYRTGGGTAGNIGKETLTTLVDSSPIVTSVTNDADFSGGADEQTIEQLRELIPASLRTLERAVAEQDYSDILIANFPQVLAASTEINNDDPAVDINIYVVPSANTITNISDNAVLKNTLTNFIDRRKTVTVQFQILDAFGVDTLVSVEIFLDDTTSKSTVLETVQSSIEDFFSLTTGGVNGAGIGFAENVLLKDISNLVESVSGVERFEIKRLTYRPRIEQDIVELVTSYNNSNVTVFPNVSESEWLVGAAGNVSENPGDIVFSNSGLVSYTYTSLTGVVQYSTFVNLSSVAPGDYFQDGAAAQFIILAVDNSNNNLTLNSGLTVNTTVNDSTDGSVVNGSTSYKSFKVFKKTNAVATNLSINSITDNNLDLSVKTGTGVAIAPRTLLDNSSIFIPSEYATGEFFLVDGASNIWSILSNDSNTINTSITAVNDASVTSITAGSYRIVKNFSNKQVIFNDSIFTIQYNSHNTIFSTGAQFGNIGTIGDSFQLSETQSNIGNLGIDLDLISYDSGTGRIKLNGSPDLAGVSAKWDLVDSNGQIFNVVGIDNRAQPFTLYDIGNQSDQFTLTGTGLGLQAAQGFQVPSTETYSVVSLWLKREGNITGNVVANITTDSGGLPNLGGIVATSNPVAVSTINNSSFAEVTFFFTTPPTLTASTQYHLVLSGDAAYSASEASGVTVFSNTGLVGFTYSAITGTVQYAAAVNLSSVLPGNFFQDGAGNLFRILAVDDAANVLTLDVGLTVNNTINDPSDASVLKNDRVFIAIDNSAPSYANGGFSQYDGSTWFAVASTDAVFSVKGTKSITVNSNLTPTIGPGATLSERYYDDDQEISFVLGVSGGLVTSATDVNALGRGTVSGNPNSDVDNFVFRTSRYTDDIVNLRLNEIPQIVSSDISLSIFGGVD